MPSAGLPATARRTVGRGSILIIFSTIADSIGGYWTEDLLLDLSKSSKLQLTKKIFERLGPYFFWFGVALLVKDVLFDKSMSPAERVLKFSIALLFNVIASVLIPKLGPKSSAKGFLVGTILAFAGLYIIAIAAVFWLIEGTFWILRKALPGT